MDQGNPAFAASESLCHRDILARLFAPAVREAVCGEGVAVVRLVSPASRRRLDLQLSCHDRIERDGELTLAVRDVDTGLILAGLTFCLVQNAGERIAIIAGVPAANDPRMRCLIRDVAKDLFGLRPKAFVLWCLQQLATPWGIRQIQAVGDEQRAGLHCRKGLENAVQHDEFWRESDGRELPGGGGWLLPLRSPCRRREELKPSRRRAHERRYSMLAALQPTLVAAFALLAPGPEGTGRIAARPVEHTCSPCGTASGAGRAMLTNDLLATNHSF
jgi:hypothetical protein